MLIIIDRKSESLGNLDLENKFGIPQKLWQNSLTLLSFLSLSFSFVDLLEKFNIFILMVRSFRRIKLGSQEYETEQNLVFCVTDNGPDCT